MTPMMAGWVPPIARCGACRVTDPAASPPLKAGPLSLWCAFGAEGGPLRTSSTNLYIRGMATHLLTVEDVFDIAGRGLIIVPGPLESSYRGPREVIVRLLLPNGEEKSASMRLESLFVSPPPKERRFGCILKSMAKADVPIGTEVWIEG